MTIYTHLNSVPHNRHYLSRYISFIERFSNTGDVRHHIAPQSMFPELKHTEDNIARLSDRAHFIAHLLLWKAYNNQPMTYAAWCMCHQNGEKITSTQYEQLQREAGKIIAKNNKQYVAVRDTDGVSKKILRQEYEANRNRYVGVTKGMTCYKDRDGNPVHAFTDDPRVLSGELVGIVKGRRLNRLPGSKVCCVVCGLEMSIRKLAPHCRAKH